MMAMTAAARITTKRARQKPDRTAGADRAVVARLATALLPSPARGGRVQLIDRDGHRIDLPDTLAAVVARAASLMSEGHKVSVIADDEMLTTQAAAERLNVSRQYIVRLVDQCLLPSIKVGTHRRLRLADVLAYKVRRDEERDGALDRLTALSEDVGGYRLGD
ncbi:helix-turn-helix domain-containing protein [Sphingomonas glacialis]|uniref:Helix-turn-helix domain-containing protein n=2 Tax=Sphingomonas glacialis TaxID=658225 RepID=A0A502G4V0_9SPHN|nr:helix-turn-helix domain-containing protein [Sphingomonas glacialis]